MNVPMLRFPEFQGEWPKVRIGNFLSERATSPGKEIPLYSLTIEFGVVPKSARYEREFLVKDGQSAYKLMLEGDLAFNPMNLRFGALGRHKGTMPVKVSKYYNIFSFSDEASKEFFEAYLLTNKMIGFYNKMATGSLNEKRRVHYLDFVDFSLPTPSLPEQKKIAEFLGVVDAKIAALRARQAGLGRYKRGLMQALFSGRLRFTKPNGTPFPDWAEKRLGEVFEVTRGRVLAMPETSEFPTTEKPYPVYSSQTKNGGLAGYYSEFLYENAINWTTDEAHAGDTRFRSGKFFCTNVCGVLLSNEGYANTFVAEIINLISEKYVSYVGDPKLMNAVMASIKLRLPHPDEQQKIADALSALDAKIQAVAADVAQMERFKKGLLQQMFV